MVPDELPPSLPHTTTQYRSTKGGFSTQPRKRLTHPTLQGESSFAASLLLALLGLPKEENGGASFQRREADDVCLPPQRNEKSRTITEENGFLFSHIPTTGDRPGATQRPPLGASIHYEETHSHTPSSLTPFLVLFRSFSFLFSLNSSERFFTGEVSGKPRTEKSKDLSKRHYEALSKPPCFAFSTSAGDVVRAQLLKLNNMIQ